MENKFKLFVIIGFAVLGLAVAGSTFLVITQLNKTPIQAEAAAASQEIKKTDLAKLELAEAITSNVYEEGGMQHIARIHVSLGVDQSDKKGYEAFSVLYGENTALIRNEIIQVIREQTYSMMSKADAQVKLGSEIANRLNKLLDTELIKEVYFKDFFVQ